MTILLEELNAKGKCTLPIGGYWAAKGRAGLGAAAPGALSSQQEPAWLKGWSFGHKLLPSRGFKMFWGC